MHARPFAIRHWPLIVLLLVLLVTAAVRWRLAAMPLERDEGEFAYAAQLLLKGEPPYLGAYNKKFPGVSMTYAAFLAAFGQTATAIRLGTLLVNAATIVLVFLLTRRLWGPTAAAMAAATYSILSTDQGAFGMAAHSEHFVVFAALAGTWAMLEALRRDRRWLLGLAGVLLGIAVLMKQSGIVFVVFAGIWVLWQQWSPREGRVPRVLMGEIALAAGAALPLALLVLSLWRAGVLARFWFWTIVYASEYGGQIQLQDIPSVFAESVGSLMRWTYPLWILAAAAAILLGVGRLGGAASRLLVTLFALSFLGTSFGFLYREHYFILVMPSIAMLLGAGVVVRSERFVARYGSLARAGPAVVVGLALVSVVVMERDYFFLMTPDEASRSTYGANPFVESPAIASYLASHTQPDDTIAILGSEAQILFYARRASATGYIYTYGLMQVQPQALGMQREMAAEIEAARPRYLVYVNVPTSWGVLPQSERWLFTWLESYTRDFEPVGLIELLPNETRFRWADPLREATARSPYFVTVLKRKSGV